MIIEKVGIHKNISNEDYHKSKGISSSGLSLIYNHCPKRYWYEYLSGQAQKKDTSSLLFGKALHTLVLEPDFFKDRFCVAPVIDKRTKAGKEAYQVLLIEAGTKDILTLTQYEEATLMANNVREHTMFKKCFKQGDIESSLLWKDKDCGAYLRSRPDYYNGFFILDLKTSRCASPDAFARSIMNYGYHRQAALACDGLTELTGETYDHVIQFVVEKEPPYLVANYRIADEAILLGRDQYKRAAEKYQECIESNVWGGYQEEVISIHLPQWAYNYNNDEVNDYV